jgi:hypothetical protein
MEIDKMCDLENCDPNDLSRPSVSPTDRRLFLAGTLALPLATILANPTGGRYDEDDAALAWARTHTFLAAHLR